MTAHARFGAVLHLGECRSSLHPINTGTRGVTGWFEAATGEEGVLDLDQPVAGELSLAVGRLTSGNRLDANCPSGRCPALPDDRGFADSCLGDRSAPHYLVTGNIAFHGKTSASRTMDIEFGSGTVVLSGKDTFHIRQFGMKPPSMLMVRVYPEVHVKVGLHGSDTVSSKHLGNDGRSTLSIFSLA